MVRSLTPTRDGFEERVWAGVLGCLGFRPPACAQRWSCRRLNQHTRLEAPLAKRRRASGRGRTHRSPPPACFLLCPTSVQRLSSVCPASSRNKQTNKNPDDIGLAARPDDAASSVCSGGRLVHLQRHQSPSRPLDVSRPSPVLSLRCHLCRHLFSINVSYEP